MRRLLAIAAVVAASGVFVALPVDLASADSAAGGGGGSYHVQVSITGSGAGSGGSLGGPAVSSGGGSVSVPSPCGYDVAVTQQYIESLVNGDLAAYQALPVNYGPNGPGSFPVSTAWESAIVSNWGSQGTWYLPGCDSGAQGKLAKFTANNPPVLVGAGGGPPQPKVDPKWLEDIARRAMTLPDPDISYNPKAGAAAETVVNVPGGTWLWATPTLAGPPIAAGAAGARSVTAAAGGESVTVTATIDSITFTTNGVTKNGQSTVSCPNGGTPYSRGARGSSCALEYVRSSGAGTYTITTNVVWSAGSTLGTALAGSTTTGRIDVKVGEIQALQR